MQSDGNDTGEKTYMRANTSKGGINYVIQESEGESIEQAKKLFFKALGNFSAWGTGENWLRRNVDLQENETLIYQQPYNETMALHSLALVSILCHCICFPFDQESTYSVTYLANSEISPDPTFFHMLTGFFALASHLLCAYMCWFFFPLPYLAQIGNFSQKFSC